ncbi:MAG: glycosyltransferase family 4 protein [Pseudomonadales bacterium]|nr:glycosyltransferase family 4 protein [Pseudomonadales bacterium]
MFVIKYFFRKKIVWTCHNLKDHENKYPLVDNFCSYRMAHLADSIIVHSDRAAKRVSEYYGVDSSYLEVIPHGNYIDYYEECVSVDDSGVYKSQSDLVFLFFGAIRPYKGVEDVVSASVGLGGTHHDLWVYGKPLNADVDAKIMALQSGQQHIVYSSGFFDEKYIRELFSSVDVVVLPMENILTSGSMVLAMSMGKACIAPKGSYAEGVLDSNGAFFYADRCEIAGVFREVIASKGRLSAMGSYNYQRAREFDWLDIAKQTCAVYSS